MSPPGSARWVLGYLIGRSPEILFIGGGANALVTFVLYALPRWRSGPVFIAWALVSAALVLASNFRGKAEVAKGMEPRPWRTLVAMQLLYVAATWAVLSR